VNTGIQLHRHSKMKYACLFLNVRHVTQLKVNYVVSGILGGSAVLF